ncbi:phosphotransferase family protein [Streptomyces specialis]|uniref:phosphotransferase family protein n=1 Tax=Streptomyces specialis TaxID=498367 RepID=UPI00073E86B7|nr:aminoglycoside phosphotransferase family protein [Streptomyces specialis]
MAEEVLADRPESTVIRVGGTVAKTHAPDTDPAALALRLAVAAHPAVAGTLLPPLPPAVVERAPGGRAVTRWPYGAPVDGDIPWDAAGALLARLHAVPVAALRALGPLPAARGPLRAVRAVARMRRTVDGRRFAAARQAVERAWARVELPGPPGPGAVLCHGDFHLGQLVRHPVPGGPWRLIDVDDAGLGDPAWDLARPAAWYAAALIGPEEWNRLLGSYQAAAGTTGQDPWPGLDVPARALTAQLAARALARASVDGTALEEAGEALVDSCVRIAALP